MKKFPFSEHNEDSINHIFFEELCSIHQIFGYEIDPNVEKLDPLNFKNCAKIKMILNSMDEKEEEISLDLNFKTSNMYPHDLPDISLTTNSFDEKNVKMLQKIVDQTAFQMCGKHMLVDILLAIEDWIRENIFEVNNDMNFIQVEEIDLGKSLDVSSSSNDADLCFYTGVKVGKSFSVFSSLDNIENFQNKEKENKNRKSENGEIQEKHKDIENKRRRSSKEKIENNGKENSQEIEEYLEFQENSEIEENKEILTCEPCISHHCGVCYTYGVFYTHEIQNGDDITAYSLRAFKFSTAKFENEHNGLDFMRFSLYSIMEEINQVKDVVNNSILIRNKAFVNINEEFAYFFIASPLVIREGLPLCSSIENLWLKVSEKTVHSIIKQLLEAIHFLHKLKIVHRSIYPCNIKILPLSKIILTDHGHVNKIWDFWQQSQNICSKISQQIETHHFHKFSEYFTNDYEGDVFQFGLVVLSLCECKIYNNYPIQIPQIFNQKLEDFTRRCVDYSKKRRYSTEQLLQHAYIKNYIPKDSLWMGAEKENMELGQNNHTTSCTDIDSRLLKEFELIKVIGRGGFGVVILAKNRVDNCIYAVKRITLTKRDWDERGKIMKEVQILSRLSHPNIVRYYNSWLEKTNIPWFQENTWTFSDDESDESEYSDEDSKLKIVFDKNAPSSRIKVEDYYSDEEKKHKDPYPGTIYIYMQMEYCEKKSLRDIIDHDSLHTNQDRLWSFFRDICSGLSYIHSQGMIHRDIKPQNILVSSVDQAKIVDFNLATRGLFHKPFGEPIMNANPSKESIQCYKSVSRVGTFPYTAPEIEYGDSVDITTKSDMYSFGIVFFEMCHKSFKTKSKRCVYITRLKRDLHIPNIPEMNKQEIIRNLLQTDPKKRFSASELLVSNLYPVPLDNIDIDKVYQHLTNEPFSTHSKKILKVYFTHEDKMDLRSQYLLKFHSLNICEASLNSNALNCVKRYAYEFFKKRGCLDFSPPTFIPYNEKKVYSFQPSLCFVNTFGVRVGLATTNLPYLFDVLSRQSPQELCSLPITRFGGIHDVFVNHDSSSFDTHPEVEKEFYYALVCTSKNIIPFLCEVITETYSIVSNFLLGNKIEDHSSIANDFYVVQSLEVHINNSQLVLSIFSQLGIKLEDQTYLLNKLKDLFNCRDAKERAAKVESFFPSKPRLKNHKPILLVLFAFEGTISEFEETFSTTFRIKFNQQVQDHLNKVQFLIDSIRSFNDQDITVKLTPYLFNNYIWPPDSFMYRYVGTQKQQNQIKTINLSTGGVYRHDLEHVKYHGYIAIENSSQTTYTQYDNEFNEQDDIVMAYSSMSCIVLSKLHRFLHFCKICHFESQNVSHENILICFRTQTDLILNFPKIHSDARYLRNEPFSFSVYVYNHSLSHEDIRSSHEFLVTLDVCAFLCVDPEDYSIKIFYVMKDNFYETCVQNIEEVGLYLKNMLSKNSLCSDRHTPNIVSKAHKHRDIRYIFLDDTYSSSVKKKYQALCAQKIKSLQNLFNTNSEFIIIVVDLLIEDFNILVTEISINNQKEESPILSPRSNQARIADLQSNVKECMNLKHQDAVYFLFNIKNSKIKPLI